MSDSAFREDIEEALARHTGEERTALSSQLTTPPQPEMGDFAFPCFALAKRMRKAPAAIAQDIAARIAQERLSRFERVEAAGAYVNFAVKRSLYAAAVLRDAAAQGPAYGSGDEGSGRAIAID